MHDVIHNYYKDNYQTLVKVISRRCGKVEDAEDIVQEAFTIALTYLETYDKSRPFNTWFNQVLYNEYRKWRKSDKMRGMTVEIEEEHMEPEEMPELTSPIMEDIVGAKEPYNKLYELVFVKNYSIMSASEISGISYPTAYRAVLKFRKRMKKKYG